MVRPADKGGGIMILDVEAYKGEMLRLLLAGNPFIKFIKELVSLVEDGFQRKILSKKGSSLGSGSP